MKGNIIILFFSLIFVPVFLQAQIQEPLLSAPPTEDPINGKIHYALTFNHTQQWNGSYTSIGGDAWIPFRQKFTLNYNLRFGLPPDGGIYVHASDGLFLGGLILGNFSEYKVLSTIGVIMLFIPEGVGYYIGKGRNKCHLSVNPLTIDLDTAIYLRESGPIWEEILPHDSISRLKTHPIISLVHLLALSPTTIDLNHLESEPVSPSDFTIRGNKPFLSKSNQFFYISLAVQSGLANFAVCLFEDIPVLLFEKIADARLN